MPRFKSCLLLTAVGALSFLSYQAHADQGPPPARRATLSIDGGQIAVPAADGSGVRVFKGLPYAAPPVGALRWQAPRRAPKWAGVRPTGKFAADCMQDISPNSPAAQARSEDCLYLNIWAPARHPAALPVFVWIHGGGSRVGSGAQPSFEGTALARQGMIVVTINYRLGVFGFLAAPGLSAQSGYGGSGNYGFMDDIAALQWVRRNIGAFGGDPNRVTVGGESSGSVSTSVLMASPLAKGLFQQAIGESGSAFRVSEPASMGAATLHSQEQRGQALMDLLHTPTVKALRAVPAAGVMAAAQKLSAQNYFNLPVVDGYVLPDAPMRMFESGRFNDVPLLAGWNAQEGSLMLLGPKQTLSQFLQRAYGPMADFMAPYYRAVPGGEQAPFIAAAGDNNIAWPTWLWAMAKARFGKAPVYLYQFDHAPPLPQGKFGKDFDVRLAGSFHGAEVPFVFGTLPAQDGWQLTPADYATARQMSGYWANFIRTGSPDGTDLAPWPRYLPGPRAQRMTIASQSAVQNDPDFARFMALLAVHQIIDPPLPAPPPILARPQAKTARP